MKRLFFAGLVFFYWISTVISFAADISPVVLSLDELLNAEVRIESDHKESWQISERAVCSLTRDYIAEFDTRSMNACLLWVPRWNEAQINSSALAVSSCGLFFCPGRGW